MVLILMDFKGDDMRIKKEGQNAMDIILTLSRTP